MRCGPVSKAKAFATALCRDYKGVACTRAAPDGAGAGKIAAHERSSCACRDVRQRGNHLCMFWQRAPTHFSAARAIQTGHGLQSEHWLERAVKLPYHTRATEADTACQVATEHLTATQRSNTVHQHSTAAHLDDASWSHLQSSCQGVLCARRCNLRAARGKGASLSRP
jgi:hypothetical protein